MLGGNYSSKFSAWLALGCISAKYIYYQIKAYEQQRQKNKSTYWLIFELYWRDFFKFTAKKYFKVFSLKLVFTIKRIVTGKLIMKNLKNGKQVQLAFHLLMPICAN